MKAYILYTATLLGALALPANGQTGNIDTKSIPAEPSMPYKLSTTVVGTNHGTMIVEDYNDEGGVIVVDNDTLVYGASNDFTTYVALIARPDTGYAVRNKYPKVYKTGKPEVTIKVNSRNDSTNCFSMPPYPVTVEMAYGEQIKSIAPITLKEEAADAESVISKLPGYVYITLETGRKDSLAVKGWVFKASGSTGDGTNIYDADDGANNRFTATLDAALPDSIVDAAEPFFADDACTVRVVNMTKPLKPNTDNKLTISSGSDDNLTGKVGDEDAKPFNGTIESANVNEIEIGQDVKDATLTLKGVTVADKTSPGTTTIKEGADLILQIEGDNDLGTLTVEQGATIVLKKEEEASLGNTTVSNSGTFRDSTASVTTVGGSGKLSIDGSLTGGGSVNTNSKVTLTATCTDKAGITSFIWQKRNADGSYTEVQKKEYDANGAPIETKSSQAFEGIKDNYEPATSSNGNTEYRCLIERTVTTTGGGSIPTTATTLLSTHPATVEVKSGGDPVIPATYYTVTLPALEGFTSRPAPGQHSVEEGYSFSFSLTPVEGNTAPTPVVTTNRGETIDPRQSDGKYVIPSIYENITITFTSLPTANEAMATENIRIQSVAGAVYIQTPQPAATVIYTLSGQLVRKLSLPAGDSRIGLPEGFYIIRIGSLLQKIIIR